VPELREALGLRSEGHAARLVAPSAWGTQRSAHDPMIAATGRTIVTHDQRGFADLPNVRVR
jgi:hypothetical protein